MRCCETERNSRRPAPPERNRGRTPTGRQVHREILLGIFSCRKEPARQWTANGGDTAEDTLFEPERIEARAIDWDQSDRGIHQGAQSEHCNPDAVYMAATDRTPESQRSTLAPRASSIHGSRTMVE